MSARGAVVRRFAAAAVVCVAAALLAPVAVVSPVAADDSDDVVIVVANSMSASDIGTAASLVAAGVGDTMLLAESADALGAATAAVVAEHPPTQAVLVGGTQALTDGIQDELGRIAAGVTIDRLAGDDRVHTSALAADLALGERRATAVVVANGWSLSDVGTAASAVASGAGDVVLFTHKHALGATAADALRALAPDRVLLVGGTAALGTGIKTAIEEQLPSASVERQGGATRVETAALFAVPALAAGADHAVIANGWELDDVAVAAAYAAADPDAVVLYTQPGTLPHDTADALRQHRPRAVTLIGSTAALSDAVGDQAADTAAGSTVRRIDAESPASAAAVAARAVLSAYLPPLHEPRRSPGETYTAVALSQHYSCALRTDQTIACWGHDDGNVLDAPDGRFTDISLERHHGCGLRTDKAIACWGSGVLNLDDWGGRDIRNLVKPPSGSFGMIDTESDYACGIRTNGQIACWGSAEYASELLQPPSGTFTHLVLGTYNACALRTNKTIGCWHNKSVGNALPEPPQGTFTHIDLYPEYESASACALRTDKTIACWGTDSPYQPPQGEFIDLTLGPERHGCAIAVDKKAACWSGRWPVGADVKAAFSSIIINNDGHYPICGIQADGSIAGSSRFSVG